MQKKKTKTKINCQMHGNENNYDKQEKRMGQRISKKKEQKPRENRNQNIFSI